MTTLELRLSLVMGVLACVGCALAVRARRQACTRRWVRYLCDSLVEVIPSHPDPARPEAAPGLHPFGARVEVEAGETSALPQGVTPANLERDAPVGSWEVELPSKRMRLSTEMFRLFDLSMDERPTCEELLERTHPADRQRSLRVIQAAIESYSPFAFDHRMHSPDGKVRRVHTEGRVALDAGGKPERLLGTTCSIAEQPAAGDASRGRALGDALSGPPDRVVLVQRLAKALDGLAHHRSTVGVIHLDIDRLQVINDSLGHAVGDQVLLAVTARLAGLLGPTDTLAHVGGDEFVVLCEGLASAAAAVGVADQICAAMAEPLALDGGGLVISVSSGLAVAGRASFSPEVLLADAEAAMHRGRIEGRAGSSGIADAVQATAIGRLSGLLMLRRSISAGQLRLRYEPIVNLFDGRVVGHASQLTWDHPTRGRLGPDEVTGVAAGAELGGPLRAWVLREACEQAKRFQALDPQWSELTMSVCLSSDQVSQPGLIELISSTVREAGLRPEHLQLEMTENDPTADAAAANSVLGPLTALGGRLAVSHFGIDRSSIGHLYGGAVDASEAEAALDLSRAAAPAEPVVEAPTGFEIHDHVVNFYDTDADIVEDVAVYLAAGLRAGEAALVVATETHRTAIDYRLAREGIDAREARAAGRYVTLDAAETLSSFMVGGAPDRRRFMEVLGGLLAPSRIAGRPVRVFGEMVALLWDDGDVSGAVALESLWNQAARDHQFSLYCAYSMLSLTTRGDLSATGEVCAGHSNIVAPRSFRASAEPHQAPGPDAFLYSLGELLSSLAR